MIDALKDQVLTLLDYATERQWAYIQEEQDSPDPMPVMGAENSLVAVKEAISDWSAASGVAIDVSGLRYPGCVGELAIIRKAIEG